MKLLRLMPQSPALFGYLLLVSMLLPFQLDAAPSASPLEASFDLTPVRHLFSQAPIELSGVAIINGKIKIVSDGKKETFIYEVREEVKNTFAALKWKALREVEGFVGYEKHLSGLSNYPKKSRRFDLEGMATCGENIYLVNERVREVLIVDDKTLGLLPLDLTRYPQINTGGANAGLEGVAVDCQKKLLYLAKEREPRRILVFRIGDGGFVEDFDFPGSSRQGQKIINPFTATGLLEVAPDISDLHFDHGSLYVLERNTFEVTKIDPVTKKVEDRVSYFKTERKLYAHVEPFGLGEALLLTKDSIIIGFDNNGTSLHPAVVETFGVSGDRGAIVYFKRPAGF